MFYFHSLVCYWFSMVSWCNEGEDWKSRVAGGVVFGWERWWRRGGVEGLKGVGSFVVALCAFCAVVGGRGGRLVVLLGAAAVWELPLWATLVCLLVPLGAVVRFGVLDFVFVYVLFMSELERNASEENDAGG